MLVYFEVNFGIFETSSGFFVDISFGFFVGIVDIEVTPVFGSVWILGTLLGGWDVSTEKESIKHIARKLPFFRTSIKTK